MLVGHMPHQPSNPIDALRCLPLDMQVHQGIQSLRGHRTVTFGMVGGPGGCRVLRGLSVYSGSTSSSQNLRRFAYAFAIIYPARGIPRPRHKRCICPCPLQVFGWQLHSVRQMHMATHPKWSEPTRNSVRHGSVLDQSMLRTGRPIRPEFQKEKARGERRIRIRPYLPSGWR